MDELKARVDAAQKALADATQQLQKAQVAQANAQAQFNIWNGALQTIIREQQARELAARENQLELIGADAEPSPTRDVAAQDAPQIDQTETVSKTEIIREIVRQHPGGITATDIWRQIGSQLKYRAYLYNVLKRLRDREEITLRRNKYSFRPSVEVTNQMVQ
jgi:hypothetical protein